jgi:hypothetical protein
MTRLVKPRCTIHDRELVQTVFDGNQLLDSPRPHVRLTGFWCPKPGCEVQYSEPFGGFFKWDKNGKAIQLS